MAKYLLVSFKTCPWVQRAAIVLRHYVDLSEDQAAEAMRVSADPASGSSKVMLRLSPTE